MPYFLENAIELDTYLVSDYPEMVKLADRLFQDVIEKAPELGSSNKKQYKTKETLKLILINLYVAYQSDVAIRYYRRASAYTTDGRYGRIWFSYKRTLLVIDTLHSLGYIETKEAVYDQRDDGTDFRRQSRMWMSDKLIEIFDTYSICTITISKEPPSVDDLVQLRDDEGELMSMPIGEQISQEALDRMISNLKRYNKFIAEQDVEVRLEADTPVKGHFLTILNSHISKGTASITALSTDKDVSVQIEDRTFQGYYSYEGMFILPHPGGEKPAVIPDGVNQANGLNQYYQDYYKNNLKSQLIDYTDDKENTTSISMTGKIIKIDEQYQSHHLVNRPRYDPKQKNPLTSYGIQRLWFRAYYQYLHRVFNRYMDLGGRFFGGLHIEFPKEVRRCIHINGSPTIELDYSGHHIRMIYHAYVGIPYQDDPYARVCETPEERNIFKRVLLVAINCPRNKNQIRAISGKLADDGYDKEYRKHNYIRDCLERVKAAHPDIADYLGSGKGIALQNFEGQIVDIILTRLMAQGVPCLPVHDSFIVPAEFKNLLLENMVNAYKRVVGPKWEPVIK